MMPVGPECLGRILNVVGAALRHLDRPTEALGLLDEALIGNLFQLRCSRENPEKPTIRCADQRGSVFRIKRKNPIVPIP